MNTNHYVVECHATEPPRPAMLHLAENVSRGDFTKGERIHTHGEFLSVESERNAALAAAAEMREALHECAEFGIEHFADCPEDDTCVCDHIKAATAALSSNAGSELLSELSAWRSLMVWGGDSVKVDALIKVQQERIHATQDVEVACAALRVEVERAKEDRNRSGVLERRKYLPQLQALSAKLSSANAGLRRIIEGVPATDGQGGLCVLHHDGDGNELGMEQVDPLAVIQSIVGVAHDTLAESDPAPTPTP